MQTPNGLVQVLLQGHRGFPGVQGFSPLILGWLWYVLVEGAASALVLHLQETLGTLEPLCQLAKDVAQARRSTTVAVKIEAQREVCVCSRPSVAGCPGG